MASVYAGSFDGSSKGSYNKQIPEVNALQRVKSPVLLSILNTDEDS